LTVSIVGPGNLGSALALSLHAAGYEVKCIAARDVRDRRSRALARSVRARLVKFGKQSMASELVWIAVPDDAITEVAQALAAQENWKERIVFHSSGALTSDELAPLRDKGARVASVHPMMTFVRGAVPAMAGVPFAIEGDAAAARAARSIVAKLGGRAFTIQKQHKVLYHAFGSLASPLLVALMASLEDVGGAAGIRQSDIKAAITPLLMRTLRNYLEHDAASAFSGPLIRGDVATVGKHLVELKKLPHVHAVYVALASAALKLLPVKNRSGFKRLLTSR
jgi:predicted short-subunit dehydrogenase-like oxidoreductase (DUF2520 family)